MWLPLWYNLDVHQLRTCPVPDGAPLSPAHPLARSSASPPPPTRTPSAARSPFTSPSVAFPFPSHSQPCTCFDLRSTAERNTFLYYVGSDRGSRAIMLQQVERPEVAALLRCTGLPSVTINLEHYVPFSARASQSEVSFSSYADGMRDSVFALVPCGNEMETHRLSEAIAIPIV
jgi:hypothetical protein